MRFRYGVGRSSALALLVALAPLPAQANENPVPVRAMETRFRHEILQLGDDPIAEALRTVLEAGYTGRILEMVDQIRPEAGVAGILAAPTQVDRNVSGQMNVANDLADAFMKRQFPGVPRRRIQTFQKPNKPPHLWFVKYKVDARPSMTKTVEVDLETRSCRVF